METAAIDAEVDEQPRGHVKSDDLERRIADRLAALRLNRGWSLETLARQTGMSRATLSRLERCELSPTAAMLSNLCGQYGWTLSRLMSEAEQTNRTVIRAKDQRVWQDPETGYSRRLLSPPRSGNRGELVEISLPPNAVVSYGPGYLVGLEHHLWMLEGAIVLELEDELFRLQKGDCMCYVLSGSSKFTNGKRTARYALAMVQP